MFQVSKIRLRLHGNVLIKKSIVSCSFSTCVYMVTVKTITKTQTGCKVKRFRNVSKRSSS